MEWNRLTVTTSNEAVAAVSNLLMEKKAGGIQIEDSDPKAVKVITYFPADAAVAELISELREEVKGLASFGLNPGAAKVELDDVGQDSWLDTWKKYYHPVRLTRFLTIVPQWTDYESQQKGEIELILDPGRSFGTGNHPTTKLTLQAVESVVRGGESLIDVGTGSGILAIAARKLGAGSIHAYDVDENALTAAKQNFKLNQINQDVDLHANDLLKGIDLHVDLILANILPQFILPLIPQVKNCLNPKGHFITSGIINAKMPEIEKKLAENGFKVDEVLSDGKWNAIIASMKG